MTSSATAQAFTLVIPVYNEEARLERNSDAFINYMTTAHADSRLVIVDDGSVDSTLIVAQTLASKCNEIVVVSRPHLGKGAATAYGLGLADTPVAGYTDVDLSTPLEEVNRLLALASHTDSLVIGSRGKPSSIVVKHQNSFRERLGRTFNVLVRATITPGVRDTQCGAKFAKLTTWSCILPLTSDPGFAWDAEAVAVAMRLGLGVEEVGIEWSHDPMTRVDVFSDGLKMAASVIRMIPRLRRMHPGTESTPGLTQQTTASA